MTASSDGKTISWLRTTPADTPEVAEIFQASVAVRGYVRNMQTVLSSLPPVIKAQDGLSKALLRGEDRYLTLREKELLALVVSVENRCEPCIFGHAAALRTLTSDPVNVAIIEINYRRATLTRRERALADYAIKVTRAPAEVLEADLELLRAEGVGEEEILEAAVIIAYFNFSNRVNAGLGIHVNAEAYSEGR